MPLQVWVWQALKIRFDNGLILLLLAVAFSTLGQRWKHICFGKHFTCFYYFTSWLVTLSFLMGITSPLWKISICFESAAWTCPSLHLCGAAQLVTHRLALKISGEAFKPGNPQKSLENVKRLGLLSHTTSYTVQCKMRFDFNNVRPRKT